MDVVDGGGAIHIGGDLVTDTVIGGVHSFLQIYNLVSIHMTSKCHYHDIHG